MGALALAYESDDKYSEICEYLDKHGEFWIKNDIWMAEDKAFAENRIPIHEKAKKWTIADFGTFRQEQIKNEMKYFVLKRLIDHEITAYGFSANYLRAMRNLGMAMSFSPVTSIADVKPDVQVVETPKKEVKKEEKRDSYTISADNILYYMMNGEEYIRNYEARLGYFDDELRRTIANEILYYEKQEKKINVADFITYVSTKDDIREEVMKIVNSCSVDELTMEAMDEYIDVLNKVLTTREIKRLKDAMKKELDEDKKTKIAMQIAELKRGSVDNG